MRLSTWVITGLSAAYLADMWLADGVHDAVAVSILRHTLQGILLGLVRFT